MNLDRERLIDLAVRYLDRQGWFVKAIAAEYGPLVCNDIQELSDAEPGLFRMVFSKGETQVQIFVGTRHSSGLAGTLRNEDAALFGALDIDGESYLAYDALADECCRLLLGIASGGAEDALRVRHVASLVSHASLVFDDRLFMKCYRVLEQGDRAEAALLFGLDEAGFNAIIAPVARWREGGMDLALIREFLPSALEGRLLALTSLRDLLAYVNETEDEAGFRAVAAGASADEVARSAGGDIAGELRRLGQTSARLHLALDQVFGDTELDPGVIASTLPASLLSTTTELGDRWGRAIRLHGDFHLRRVMRSDAGWLISGFGDDPMFGDGTSGGALQVRVGSPLEDVADMFFALADVAHEALRLRPLGEQPFAEPLAEAWIRRSRDAFLRGYLEVEGIEAILPSDEVLREELLGLFLAVREQRYRTA
jgi:predicted trehalose synthase